MVRVNLPQGLHSVDCILILCNLAYDFLTGEKQFYIFPINKMT